MDPRKTLRKIGMFVDNDALPGRTLTLTGEEARSIRDLITEMNLRRDGDNLDMKEWESICEAVTRNARN